MARRSQATCKSDSTSPKLNLRLPVRIARRRRLTLSGERMARGPAGHSDCLEPVRVPADGSDGLAQTTFRRDDGMNPDSPGDERHRAGLLRSRRISVPFPWGSRRSCGQLRLRSLRRSLSNRLRNPSVRIQARYSGLLSGPRRGWNRFLRTGTLRRKGTRLLSTITSIRFSVGGSAQPRTPQWHPEPGVICLQRRDAGQDDRTRPANCNAGNRLFSDYNVATIRFELRPSF